MKLHKSLKTLLVVILLLIIGLIVTQIILSHDKWLFYRISTIDDSNKLTEKVLVDLGKGCWFVKSEDSLSYSKPSVDDENWTSERFLYIALLKNGHKTTWLRKHFVAPEHINADTLLLRLSLFDIQARVYVNGRKIADSCFIFDRSVCCYVSRNDLFEGKDNLIAVKAQSMIPNPANQSANYRDELLEILQPTINLAGFWKFKTGDQETWKEKDYNDSSFTTIYAPMYWDDQGYKDYDGIAWYRKTFTVPVEMCKQQLIFVAGKIDDFGEIYINGHKIGGHIVKTKNIQDSEWDTYNLYPFSGKLLANTNTVAIRVIDNQLRGGIHQGPVGIISMDNYLKFIEARK